MQLNPAKCQLHAFRKYMTFTAKVQFTAQILHVLELLSFRTLQITSVYRLVKSRPVARALILPHVPLTGSYSLLWLRYRTSLIYQTGKKRFLALHRCSIQDLEMDTALTTKVTIFLESVLSCNWITKVSMKTSYEQVFIQGLLLIVPSIWKQLILKQVFIRGLLLIVSTSYFFSIGKPVSYEQVSVIQGLS